MKEVTHWEASTSTTKAVHGRADWRCTVALAIKTSHHKFVIRAVIPLWTVHFQLVWLPKSHVFEISSQKFQEIKLTHIMNLEDRAAQFQDKWNATAKCDIPMDLIMLTNPVFKIRNLSLEPRPSTCNACSVLRPLPRSPFCSRNKKIIPSYYMKVVVIRNKTEANNWFCVP